ncbi:MAG TPA: phosphoribosylanthranilate isomerase [Gemmatimonadales bacterium]|nr:phosphoribosylanthranilate isomerase [Gemmatimonadales bacterium]
MPVPVKICGLTRPADAALAARLGARYLGVIFAGGPRLVTRTQAREVVASAGSTPVIGVFGSQGTDEILEVCEDTGLQGVQLHDGASSETVGRLRSRGLLVLVTQRLNSPVDLMRLDDLKATGAPVLIEAKVPGQLGGSGVALPHELARSARIRLAGHTMFLAGGLTPETVAAAVRVVEPDAVDVSSGVEQIPGIKDHQRMARFLEVLGWV